MQLMQWRALSSVGFCTFKHASFNFPRSIWLVKQPSYCDNCRFRYPFHIRICEWIGRWALQTILPKLGILHFIPAQKNWVLRKNNCLDPSQPARMYDLSIFSIPESTCIEHACKGYTTCLSFMPPACQVLLRAGKNIFFRRKELLSIALGGYMMRDWKWNSEQSVFEVDRMNFWMLITQKPFHLFESTSLRIRHHPGH